MPRFKLLFIGISGREYPHTRVRCYNFAERLAKYAALDTRVLSFRDHLSRYSEVEMWSLRDREKIRLNLKALPKLLRGWKTVFYIQKVHYHAAAAYLLHRMGYRKYIFDYDDYDVDLTVSFNHHGLRRFFFGMADHLDMTRNLAGNALGCVASSRALVDFLSRFNPHVAYISTGVDTDVFPFTDRSGRKGPVVFLWNGIIWGDEILQSVLMALRCFRQVVRQTPDVVFRIIGTGQSLPKVDEALNTEFADIAQKVQRLSWVTPGEMPGILAQADVGLLPFAVDSPWIRSKSPTKLFEYMATGLPVVASDLGEVQHVIQDARSGLLAKDEEQFTGHMIRLAAEPGYRLEIGRGASDRIIRQFSLSILCERLFWFLNDRLHGA